jgi:hypothetical protein
VSVLGVPQEGLVLVAGPATARVLSAVTAPLTVQSMPFHPPLSATLQPGRPTEDRDDERPRDSGRRVAVQRERRGEGVSAPVLKSLTMTVGWPSCGRQISWTKSAEAAAEEAREVLARVAGLPMTEALTQVFAPEGDG